MAPKPTPLTLDDGDELLTRSDSADLVKTSIKTIERRISAGILPAYRFGPELRIKRSDLLALLQQVPTGGVNHA